jgi:hypothetical protein
MTRQSGSVNKAYSLQKLTLKDNQQHQKISTQRSPVQPDNEASKNGMIA